MAGRISTAFSNLLVRIVSRFNILLRGCGICIDLKFSEAISRSCVLCSFEGKEARGNLVATWRQQAVGRSGRQMGSNLAGDRLSPGYLVVTSARP